jgi:hypothetical protein
MTVIEKLCLLRILFILNNIRTNFKYVYFERMILFKIKLIWSFTFCRLAAVASLGLA